jgi:hypothetical protein
VDDLPVSQKRAIYIDSLIDIALDMEQWTTVASAEDLAQFAQSLIRTTLVISPEIELSGFTKDLVTKLNLYFSSSSISMTERLVSALRKETDTNEKPDRQYMVVSGNRLAVRVPVYDSENLGQIDNLGKYLRWAVTILGLKDPEVKILQDATLGTGIQLPARIERMMDNTIAALTLPPEESGDRANFRSGLKGNLIELLAAVKLMRKFMGATQKGVTPKASPTDDSSKKEAKKEWSPTTLEDLKRSINVRSGLKEPGVSTFTQIFVKNVFNELTKPTGKFFPGMWIHSLKKTNGVNNNVGIIYKLGYETKVPNVNKVYNVVMHEVALKDSVAITAQKRNEKVNLTNSNSHVRKITEKNRLSESTTHQEFRMGVFLTLPLLDPKSSTSPKDQLSTDPLTVRDKKVLGFYSKNRDVVDALYLAYATLQALPKKNSKATPLGYRSARGHAMRLTANREFMDATGQTYQLYSDIPVHIREYLQKLFMRKFTQEESDSEDESESGDQVLPTKKAKST